MKERIRKAKRELYDAIGNFEQGFPDSWDEDTRLSVMFEIIAYYNNFEETMAWKKMTPEECLEYAYQEIRSEIERSIEQYGS